GLKEEILRLEKVNKNATDALEGNLVSLANTRLHQIHSQANGQTYQLKVSFPKNYDQESNKRYPVLYVTDAETNFGGINYIVQRLIKDRLIPPILVVGVAYNTDYGHFYKLRSRDLTPEEAPDLKMGGKVDPTGGAPAFCDFFEFELFPFIADNFRVKAEERALYGHSYGGLFGCYVLMNRPQLFKRYLLLSPSLWFKDNLLVKQLAGISPSLQNKDIYFASGEFEGRIDDLQEEFVSILRSKEIENLSLKSEVMDHETHRTIFGPGFTNGLRTIYAEYGD
ncbi:MAG: alpha/beta hydrolase-fold protein, partial [Bacteroidota bacterium]